MNKYNFNLKSNLKKGFALVSAAFVMISFNGCSQESINKGLEPDDASSVSSKVNEIKEIKKNQIIDECIKHGNENNYTERQINNLINERLYEEHLISYKEFMDYKESIESSHTDEETKVYTLN